jgi:hypothetical protein
MNRHLSFAISLLLALSACQKSKTSSVSQSGPISACDLITNDEVQSIQGSPVKDVKPSEASDGKFRIAQCFYTTEVFNRSVSLAVTQRDPAGASARDPREFWKDTFGKYESQVKKEEGDEQKKKSLRDDDEGLARPPKKIEGVGDDAFWTANRMGGALYILKNNVFIRISIGGPESEESKVEKTKALAAKAVSRL